MKTIAVGWISLLVGLSGCNSASAPRYEPAPEETRISIAGLKSHCDGQSSVPITEDLSIRGQVVANDIYGEFDRQIVIQDASGGIAIALDGARLHDWLPFGILVEVRCNGLVLSDYGGKIELGYVTDEFGRRTIPADVIDRYIRVLDLAQETPRVVRLSFDQVDSRHINTRVQFDGVRFLDQGASWCDTDDSGLAVTTEREIVDENGQRFLVRTLRNCDYAMEELPAGEGSLTGVIDYFGGKFSLRVTFHEMDF